MSAAATGVMVIQMVMRRMCPFKFGSHVARRVSPASEAWLAIITASMRM